MKQNLTRLGAALALSCVAFGALVGSSSPPAPLAAQEPASDSLDDELQRVLLEQELMLSERTAVMLEELEQRLANWQPAHEGGRGA